jgi:anti-sigma B factor antagonist
MMSGDAGGPGMVRVCGEFPRDLGELAALRAAVRDGVVAAWGGDDEETLGLVELAVQEAAANIVLHAYGGEKDRPVVLEVEAGPDQCRVTLTHRGKDFDPAAVAPPSFDGSRSGGFGHYLMCQTMDEVRYLHDGEGRSGVRLTKRRVPAGGKKMQMLVEKFGDVAVVALHEEQLDAGNADDFREAVAPVLEEFKNLVLDLNRVRFVDSRGCGAILSCLKATTEAGGDLRLCNVTRPVRTVFDFIRLHRICDILETKEQTVAAFAAKK